MRKTYAYNSIIIGFLVGLLVYASTSQKMGSTTPILLGILAWIAVSIVGFIIIRAIEKAIGAGIDKAADAAAKAYQERKQRKQ
ncbi:MAG: hypothetical protein IKH21_04970 [Clostridia bacterium]|nr:hypothetical protein [Clostridia bacterium]